MFTRLLNSKIKLCWFFLLMGYQAEAQHFDSSFTLAKTKWNNQSFHLKEMYIPAVLIAVASYSNHEETFINNEAIKMERDENMPHFRTHIDDYMQYAPIIAGYGFITAEDKNDAWLYTKEILLNQVILTASVTSVKHFSKVPSIVNGSYNAFPSGHTAQAFSAATLFNDNFAKHKLWLQCLTYGTATSVGVLRILNERHWTSDVVAGAGFGILSAKISEWILTPRYNKKHLSTFN